MKQGEKLGQLAKNITNLADISKNAVIIRHEEK